MQTNMYQLLWYHNDPQETILTNIVRKLKNNINKMLNYFQRISQPELVTLIRCPDLDPVRLKLRISMFH